MSPSIFLRQLRRETRGSRGRVIFFAACLAIGVAAVTAVAGLSAAVERSVRGEARQLLAADVAISSRRPIVQLAPELEAALAARVAALGARRADLAEMVTVVLAQRTGSGPRSQLVELKAVRGAYPFYGKLTLEPPLAGTLEELLAERAGVSGVVAAPDLLRRLGLAIGDRLSIGGREFELRAVVVAEPDRVAGAFSAGPRAFVGFDSLASTSLLGLGSRISYRTLLALPPPSDASAAQAAAEALKADFRDAPQIEVESYPQGQPGLRQGIERAERFLGLVALLSLLLGGIGIAQTVRSWLQTRLDGIAIFKCLGMRPREALTLVLTETALLALVASALGVALGLAVQWVVPSFLGAWIATAEARQALRTLEPTAILRGLGLGVATATLFALGPVLQALRVPAVRVLRRDAEPLPPGRLWRLAIGLAIGGGVWTIAALQARSWSLGAGFTAALAGAFLALALAAWATRALAVRFGRSPRRRPSLNWRLGLASLERPNSPTLSAIVAVGFGGALVLAVWMVETQLSRQLTRQVPLDAPTAFLIDVQPAQWPPVNELLEKSGAESTKMVPVVMARIAAIDGQAASDLARPRESPPSAANAANAANDANDASAARDDEGSNDREDSGEDGESGGARRWAMTREQRLTTLQSLPEDNTVIAGAVGGLWSDPARAEVSVEEEYARDLGIRLGSTVRFDIQGVPVEVVVTSLRRVRWESFGINFFWVVEPGVIDDAPQWRLASTRLPVASEQGVQDTLAERYPNVTLLKIRDVLDQIATVLGRVGAAVRFLGGFTVLAGLAILAGSVAAGETRRRREAALYKTLGMTRFGVARAFASEYALMGLIAGTVGAAAGATLAWLILTRGMDAKFENELGPPLVAIALTVVLSVTAGLAASAGALRRKPIEVLREE